MEEWAEIQNNVRPNASPLNGGTANEGHRFQTIQGARGERRPLDLPSRDSDLAIFQVDQGLRKNALREEAA